MKQVWILDFAMLTTLPPSVGWGEIISCNLGLFWVGENYKKYKLSCNNYHSVLLLVAYYCRLSHIINTVKDDKRSNTEEAQRYIMQ